MPKPYGISGTPWHVERVHNNDPDDGRRHRSRCLFYVPETKACTKNSSCCYGASHCDWYREKTADLVEEEEDSVTRSLTFQKNVTMLQANKPLPLKKENSSAVTKSQNTQTSFIRKIRRGSLIGFGASKYFVWDIKQDDNLQFVYICKPVVEKTAKSARDNKFWLFDKWVLSDNNVKIPSDKVGSVEQLSSDITNRIFGTKLKQDAAEKNKKREMLLAQKKEPRPERYSFVKTENCKSPAGKRTKKINVDVYYQSKLKHLPAFEDPVEKKIYISKTLYEKYKSCLYGPKGFFISER